MLSVSGAFAPSFTRRFAPRRDASRDIAPIKERALGQRPGRCPHEVIGAWLCSDTGTTSGASASYGSRSLSSTDQ